MPDPMMAFRAALVPHAAMLVAYFVGIVLAISYGRSLRRVALIAGIGFGLLFVSALVGVASQYWLITQSRGLAPAAVGAAIVRFALTRDAIAVGGIICMMIAIFARRGGREDEIMTSEKDEVRMS